MGFDGRCLCGAVTYSSSAAPVFAGNCHCKDCQRASGGPYTPALMFAAATLQIRGTPKYYASRADSGRTIERGFCPECGSQMFSRLEGMPGMLGVRAGTLDDAAQFKPQLDFFVKSAQPWDHMDPTLPKKPGSPRA